MTSSTTKTFPSSNSSFYIYGILRWTSVGCNVFVSFEGEVFLDAQAFLAPALLRMLAAPLIHSSCNSGLVHSENLEFLLRRFIWKYKNTVDLTNCSTTFQSFINFSQPLIVQLLPLWSARFSSIFIIHINSYYDLKVSAMFPTKRKWISSCSFPNYSTSSYRDKWIQ